MYSQFLSETCLNPIIFFHGFMKNTQYIYSCMWIFLEFHSIWIHLMVTHHPVLLQCVLSFTWNQVHLKQRQEVWGLCEEWLSLSSPLTVSVLLCVCFWQLLVQTKCFVTLKCSIVYKLKRKSETASRGRAIQTTMYHQLTAAFVYLKQHIYLRVSCGGALKSNANRISFSCCTVCTCAR